MIVVYCQKARHDVYSLASFLATDICYLHLKNISLSIHDTATTKTMISGEIAIVKFKISL